MVKHQEVRNMIIVHDTKISPNSELVFVAGHGNQKLASMCAQRTTYEGVMGLLLSSM